MSAYAMLDVETTEIRDGEIPRTLFWGLGTADGKYRDFKNTRRLAQYLLRESAPLFNLHHANFDIVQLLVDGVRDLKIDSSHNGRIIKSSWREHRNFNSVAMYPCPLADILAAYGYKKIALDDLAARNYSDCVHGLECCLRLAQQFEDLVGESPLHRHTVASTSFHAAEAVAGKLDKDLRFLEAYRGGKVEVYDVNEWIADEFDINSSYPYSFLDAPPTGKLLYCEVECEDNYGPFFHAGHTERLVFPAGKFKTWIYEDVYERYIKPYADAHTLRVLESYYIDLTWLGRVGPLITKLYNLKAASPKGGAVYTVCKFLLNAMYGRIGMRGERERCQILPYMPDGDDMTIYRIADDRWLCFDKRPMEPRSNYPLAAYITDNARGRLFAACKQSNAIYCDTDSIFCRAGYVPDNVGSLLGQFKFVGQAQFQANNVKDYTKNGVRKVKGGVSKVQWTLKKWAAGLPAQLVERDFSGVLYKRVKHLDGTTEPIRVA